MPERRYPLKPMLTLEDRDAMYDRADELYDQYVQRTIDDQAEAEREQEAKLHEYGIGSF